MTDAESISDDSSFYGGDELKRGLEAEASKFRPDTYWSTHHSQPAVIAYKATSQDPAAALSNASHNIYKDYLGGRQLSETVDEFLKRLAPYSTPTETCGPWIYISNPSYDPNKDREDLRSFKDEGNKLLSAFKGKLIEMEGSDRWKSKSALVRKLNEARRDLQTEIFDVARKRKVTAGKWMLFPAATDVNHIWSPIAHATAAGELGHAAKVAANDGSGDSKARLMCVYNEDFEDKTDVKRVLEKLDRMGLVKRDRGIYYKADAFTHLEINSGNEWGLKPSLYASKDVFKDDWTR